MNFREKVKAIVSEAGVKKLTRQLHSRPRNIPKAVDRLNQRDYRRTSGKARSGDRKATKQLAQMHQQSTTQPVLAPKKSKRDRDVGLSEAGVKKLHRVLWTDDDEGHPVMSAGQRAQQRYKETSSKARKGSPKAKSKLEKMHKKRTTQPTIEKSKRESPGISEDSDATKPVKLPVLKRIPGKIKKLSPDTLAYIQRIKAEEAAKKKSKPETDLAHTEIPFREKVKDLFEAYMKPADARLQHKREGQKFKNKLARKKSIPENSDHPFYQKVKSLSRGKKNNSLLEKKSKTIRLLIGKIKPCGEKSNVDETYESTRKWQPGDEPKQTGREPATTKKSEKAYEKKLKKWKAEIKARTTGMTGSTANRDRKK